MGEDQNFNHSEFLNLLPEIVFELDNELFIRFINQSCEDILGYPIKKLINKRLPIEKLVVPEDIERIKEDICQSFEGKLISGNSYKIITTKKEILSVEIYYNPILQNSTITGLRCIAIDITEKERTHELLSSREKHYRQIFQNFPLPYQAINNDGIILDVNPTWIKSLKYTKKEVIGKNFISILSEKDHIKFKNVLKKLNAKGEVSSVHLDLIKKDGAKIFINFHSKLENSTEGITEKFHCVFSDITLQRKAEQTLIESELRLRNLIATKDKFFSIIAHDLKNPFNDLIGFTQLLSLNIHKYDKTKIEQFTSIIHQSSKLAYNLLENLLDWSRSQTGTLNFKPEKISINNLVRDNIELLGSMAQSKSIKIYSELESDFFAYADKNMIKTIIRNLISNAIKYTNQGGHINIVCSNDHKNCKISIIDNGIGISKKNISKILKIDESYSTSGTENEKGTGLGLILCKEFIEKNKGKLFVQSELDKGSTFSFTLPLPEIEQ